MWTVKADWKSTFWACALLVVVSFLAYAPVWNAYFLADDFAYVGLYANRPFTEWVEIFAKDWTRGVWGSQMDELRSMMALTFWWDGKLWPFQPLGYHTTNILIHAASSIMVFLLARTLFGGVLSTSLLAGLLFSLYPAHSEAVSWISGRADPICTFFSLVSLWTFALYRSQLRIRLYVVSLAAFFLALFSKEIAITFPLLPLGYDLFRKKTIGERWRGLIPGLAGFWVLLAIYMLIRRSVFPHAIRENVLTLAVVREFAFRQVTYLKFLFPGPPFAILLLLLCAAAAVVFLLWKHRDQYRQFAWPQAVLFFGPWWYLVSVIPLIITYASPRHLYLTSVGPCLLIAAFLRSLFLRRMFAAASVCLLCGFMALLVRQNLRWSYAARVSYQAQSAIVELARTVRPGVGLILNIPAGVDTAYLWLASLPLALESPYVRTDIYPQFRVLEKPVTYRYWSGSPDRVGRTWVEDRRPVLEDLIANPSDCYFVSLNKTGQIVTTHIPAASVSRKLAPLLQLVASRNPYDSIFSLDEEWELFWKRALAEGLSQGGRGEQ